MPYAVIEDGGKQYQVKVGDEVLIEHRAAEPRSEIVFPRVLLYHDGQQVHVGRPLVDGITVAGQVLRELKAPKAITLKYRRRTASSKRKVGHRQRLLAVRIVRVGT